MLSTIPKCITPGIVQLWHHSHSFERLFCPIVTGKITSFIQNTSHQCINSQLKDNNVIVWKMKHPIHSLPCVCMVGILVISCCCDSSNGREREKESDLIRDEVNCTEKWVIPFVLYVGALNTASATNSTSVRSYLHTFYCCQCIRRIQSFMCEPFSRSSVAFVLLSVRSFASVKGKHFCKLSTCMHTKEW